ncbi:beta-N-acetylhexosaminidase [Maricaulis sp.]|uniref:beta-N-acetylhexosaminidase n=1 Tax=Maricaulis sp. TaxID=1486257 RepID=UPI0026218E38|nr:beta-N-acetylhexosaminidase [Maricaulis sp.]
MSARSVIYGFAGLELSPDERAFFRDADPWGFIVFARNIDTPKQLARLTMSLRDCVGRDAPVLIDQEGGRVRRLRPPHWREMLPAQPYGDLYLREPEAAIEAVRLNHHLMAQEMRAVGVDVDCVPCLDLRVPGADAIIGDRALGETPQPIIDLGRAAMEGVIAGGVAPIIKHIPGHGRASVDSHLELPVVDAEADLLRETDFAPFQGLNDAPMAMTAHIIYSAIDAGQPATTSPDMVQGIIRDEIGFDGLLMTDDLSMKALSGSFRDRGEASLRAGCDMLLHCNGDMSEMQAVAESAVTLEGQALERADTALDARGKAQPIDASETESRLNSLLDLIEV